MRQSALQFRSHVVWSDPHAHAWTIDLAYRPDLTSARCSALDAHEVERARSFRFNRHREEYIACWHGVRSLLSTAVGVDLVDVHIQRICQRCGAFGHGKPRAGTSTGRAIEFSVAHASGIALLSIARTPVGVDIERNDRDVRDFVRVIAHPSERAAVESSADPNQVLLRLWVRKEAALKATGNGLTVAPSSIEVLSLESVADSTFEGWVDGAHLRIHDVPIPGCQAAVAVVASSVEGRSRG